MRLMAAATSLHQLFERQVFLHPNALALVCHFESITYIELNRRANQLAWRLRSRGIGTDSLVGVLDDRSIAMVVAILAILKAGATYVPLNPDEPAQQLALIIEDACLDLMLVQSGFTAGAFRRVEQLYIDVSIDICSPLSVSNLPYHGSVNDIAYVIFTSSLDSRPNRVSYEHGAVSSLLLQMRGAYGISTIDRILLKTPLYIDISVLEFLLPLVNGAQIILARSAFRSDLIHLSALIQLSGVTATSFDSSLLHLFLEHKYSCSCRSLKHIWCCGEILSPSIINLFYERLPEAHLHYIDLPNDLVIQTTHLHCGKDDLRELATISGFN